MKFEYSISMQGLSIENYRPYLHLTLKMNIHFLKINFIIDFKFSEKKRCSEQEDEISKLQREKGGLQETINNLKVKIKSLKIPYACSSAYYF